MLVRTILQKANFGSSVAEQDQRLQNYFVVTGIFDDLIADDVDIIAGEKGTGKTSLYLHLKQSYTDIPELQGVEILTGFNPSGEPMFRRLGMEEKKNYDQYKTVWKMYFLSLTGNWLLNRYSPDKSGKAQQLADILDEAELLNDEARPVTIFTRLMNWLRKNATPKSVGIEMTINELGIPVITPKIDLGSENQPQNIQSKIIDLHHAFSTLNEALAEKELKAWVVMDRLDEAFVGKPEIEALALKALIQAYLDLQEFKSFSLKLFIRKDLFRKITKDGFVNLDHVSGRKREILWSDDDLLCMVCQRLRQEQGFLTALELPQASDEQIFAALFLGLGNPVKRGVVSWSWLLAQIRDGNKVKAPRNVIDVCRMAKEEQLKKERNAPRGYLPGTPLIESEALKQALARLSALRLEDTLLAEYGMEIKQAIKAFTNGKSDHTNETLAELFNHPAETELNTLIEGLCDIGFLTKVGKEYRVPPLYRKGLNITQGKAGG